MAATGSTDTGKLTKRERLELICSEARRRGVVRITEIAGRLGVSGETVRRDLDELAISGRLRRIYGGATPPAGESAGEQRASVEARARLADAAAQRVKPGQTVMVSGTAARQLAQEMARQVSGITLITNAVGIAAVCGADVEVVLCPGTYDPETDSVYGEDAVSYLGRFNADLAVISGCALSPRGASDARRGSAPVKRAMLAAAARSILVVEAGELGRTAVEIVAPLGAFAEIFIGGAVPAPLAAACRERGVRLMAAQSRHRR